MKNPTQIFTNLFFTAYYNASALRLLQEKIYPQKSSITNFVNHFKTGSNTVQSEYRIAFRVASQRGGAIAFQALKIVDSPEVREDIMEHCRRHIAKYAMPYEIEVRSDLPKTLVGKVAYTKLS